MRPRAIILLTLSVCTCASEQTLLDALAVPLGLGAGWGGLPSPSGWVDATQCRLCNIRKMVGRIDDCCCDFEVVDFATEAFFAPLLENLTQRVFFRHFKVNLDKKCPFWEDDGMCVLPDCVSSRCAPDEVPGGKSQS